MRSSATWALLQKELVFEWRQKYGLGGILLYVGATLIVLKYLLPSVTPDVYLALYWLILLFATINVATRGLTHEPNGTSFFYYTIASAEEVFAARLIYAFLLLAVVASLTWGGMYVLLGNPIEKSGLFIVSTLMGCAGFAAVGSLLSAIAGKGSGAGTLLPVLAFPVLIPQLVMLLRIGKKVLEGSLFTYHILDILSLGAMVIIVLTLSFLLFPYLWRD